MSPRKAYKELSRGRGKKRHQLLLSPHHKPGTHIFIFAIAITLEDKYHYCPLLTDMKSEILRLNSQPETI